MISITDLKLSVFLLFTAFFFINGGEMYIILPTAWYYIHFLRGSKSFYGVVMASYSLGFLLFCLPIAKLGDKTRRVKLLLLVSVLVKVIANVVYAIPLSVYCPLMGCFFSGAANSAFGVIYGEIVRNTKPINRSKLFVLIDSTWALGATCGPAFGSMITFQGDILGWKINDGNSPGVVLAIVWSLMLCALIFVPAQFGTEKTYHSSKEEVNLHADMPEKPVSLIKSFSSSVCCLYYLNFANSLLASAFTVLAPLLSMELFHWKLVHVKLLFATAMMFLFVLYLSIYIATNHFGERVLLAFTVSLQLASLIILVCYAVLWSGVTFSLSYILIIYICVGTPQVSFALIGSLLSKMTPTQHASIIQNFAILGCYTSYLAGRGMAGAMFAETWLLGFTVALFVIWFVGIVWLVLEFSRLAPDQLFRYS